jgi:DNA-directed RNA polymerase specialized sigma24 family protein
MPHLTPYDRLRLAHDEYAALLRIARRRTRSADDALDAVHEALVQVAEADVHDPARVLPWARVALVHICADMYRGPSPERRARVHTPGDYLVPDHAEEVCDRAEWQWLRQIVAALPKKHLVVAEVLMMGGGVREVADRLGVSYKAAEHRVARTKSRLRHAVAVGRAAALLVMFRRAVIRRRAMRAAAGTPLLLLTALVLLPVPQVLAIHPPAEIAVTPHPTATPQAMTAPLTTAHARQVQARHTTSPTASTPAPTASQTRLDRDPGGGKGRRASDDVPLTDELLWCVQHGLVITREYVGCTPRPSASPMP